MKLGFSLLSAIALVSALALMQPALANQEGSGQWQDGSGQG
jgi:hypothetical protein